MTDAVMRDPWLSARWKLKNDEPTGIHRRRVSLFPPPSDPFSFLHINLLLNSPPSSCASSRTAPETPSVHALPRHNSDLHVIQQAPNTALRSTTASIETTKPQAPCHLCSALQRFCAALRPAGRI